MTVALVGIIGVLLGAFIGNRLAWDRDDRISRSAFVSRLCEHKATAAKIKDENFPEWFAKAQIDIEKQCGLVQVAIHWRHRKRFAAARKRCSQPETIDDIADASPFSGVPFTYNRGRTEVINALDELIVCAN